jgi:hypothetical protein
VELKVVVGVLVVVMSGRFSRAVMALGLALSVAFPADAFANMVPFGPAFQAQSAVAVSVQTRRVGVGVNVGANHGNPYNYGPPPGMVPPPGYPGMMGPPMQGGHVRVHVHGKGRCGQRGCQKKVRGRCGQGCHGGGRMAMRGGCGGGGFGQCGMQSRRSFVMIRMGGCGGFRGGRGGGCRKRC